VVAKKRKKKKTQVAQPPTLEEGAAAAQSLAPQHVAPQPAPTPIGLADVPPQPAMAAPTVEVASRKTKKGGRCWKCAVNTHATKDCKVVHYCLVCDNAAHPTVRCPILKLPKPLGYFVGCGNDATINPRLPDSVHKPHLMSLGVPTALV
jgi:hypothetical protein